jgi:hypothetical protein
MSIKGIAAKRTIKKEYTFSMPVALFIALKVVQSFTMLPALGRLCDETGRSNETFTALFTWHDSKKTNTNAMHVKTILSAVCK